MANLVKLPKKTTAAPTTDLAPEKEDNTMSSTPSKEVPAGSKKPEQIEVAGRSFDVVERRKLHTSPKAGIPDGAEYPVVVEEDKNGKKTFKAVHGEHLYTIKNYGKGEDEVIIKLRESRGERKPRSTSSADEDVNHPDLALDEDVLDLLSSYKSLEHKLDPEAWINNQLRKILTDEVARLEKLRDGMKKLPADILGDLAGADPAMLEKIRAMLRGG